MGIFVNLRGGTASRSRCRSRASYSSEISTNEGFHGQLAFLVAGDDHEDVAFVPSAASEPVSDAIITVESQVDHVTSCNLFCEFNFVEGDSE